MKQENKDLIRDLEETIKYLMTHCKDQDLDGIRRDINSYIRVIDKALVKAEAYDTVLDKCFIKVVKSEAQGIERYGIISLSASGELNQEQYETIVATGI